MMSEDLKRQLLAVTNTTAAVDAPAFDPIAFIANLGYVMMSDTACKLTECQGKPRCDWCRALDAAHPAAVPARAEPAAADPRAHGLSTIAPIPANGRAIGAAPCMPTP